VPLLGFFSRRLTPTEHALADIAQGLRSFNARMERMERQMATNQEILDRLVAEGTETTAKVDLLLASNEAARADIATFGDRLKQAVADALAANPGIDLTAAAKVADDLDALQARMETARQALDAAVEADKTPAAPPAPPAGEGA
jgi:chromosome segregation ATPase